MFIKFLPIKTLNARKIIQQIHFIKGFRNTNFKRVALKNAFEQKKKQRIFPNWNSIQNKYSSVDCSLLHDWEQEIVHLT